MEFCYSELELYNADVIRAVIRGGCLKEVCKCTEFCHLELELKLMHTNHKEVAGCLTQ